MTEKKADRIKVILSVNDGWTYEDIARVLLIHQDTVSRHVHDFITQIKLENTSGGSVSFLSTNQAELLKTYLSQQMYANSELVCVYVFNHFGVKYSVAGMTSWLHHNGFSYRLPNQVQAKANAQDQKDFVKQYEMTKTTEKQGFQNEVTLFFDAMHPTISTKICKAWLPEGKHISIQTTGAKTRVNVAGSLNLKTMDFFTTLHETISSTSMQNHLCILRNIYPHQKINIILDQGSYNRSQATKDCAAKLGIKLTYLPPYSPNLNPTERVWKIFNECVRNNKTFANGKDFEEKVAIFFRRTWDKIKEQYRGRVNDNFQIIQPCTSS